MKELFFELSTLLRSSRIRSLAENSPMHLIGLNPAFKTALEVSGTELRYCELINEVLDYLE